MKNLISFIRVGKRGFFLLMTFFLALQNVKADVTINSTNFPDNNFRNYLISKFGDVLSQSEINATKTMDLSFKQISSLEGIKYFTELEKLQLYSNKLTSLYLYNNTKLTELECACNNLTDLNLYYNTKLIGVVCDDNQLTSLYVPSINLQWLSCSNNNLTSCLRDVTFSFLKELYCANNPNMTEVGAIFRYLPALERFDCSGTKINGLNLNDCTKMKELTCENNTAITQIECTNTTLSKLMVSGCSNLKTLTCNNNNLSYIDIYGCSSLQKLDCKNNQLTSITYMNSCKSSLEEFNCSSNKISSLDMSGYNKLKILYCANNSSLTSLALNNNDHPNLEEVDCSNCDIRDIDWSNLYLSKLDCSYNSNLTHLNNSRGFSFTPIRPLTSLAINGCVALELLNVDYNQLTSIDLSSCSNLEEIHCKNNKLTSLGLSSCTKLTQLDCSSNNLISLNLSNNRNIQRLVCSFNNIESLNVKGYTSLSELYCTSCQLTILDLRGCDALYKMLCGYNQLSTLILPKESTTLRLVECNNNYLEGEFMDILVNSLPDRKNMTGGAFRVLGGFSGDQNVCTWQNIVDAKSKNWGTYVISPEDGSWILYTYDSPTTIRMAESDVDDDAPRYNMSGQRVGRDYRGVVIVNGRKVVK